MEIKINGNTEIIDGDSLDLQQLLQLQEIEAGQQGIAVALNFSVIPRTKWADTLLYSGDEVEIIRATAGG